jgi:hypothetical protein
MMRIWRFACSSAITDTHKDSGSGVVNPGEVLLLVYLNIPYCLLMQLSLLA